MHQTVNAAGVLVKAGHNGIQRTRIAVFVTPIDRIGYKVGQLQQACTARRSEIRDVRQIVGITPAMPVLGYLTG